MNVEIPLRKYFILSNRRKIIRNVTVLIWAKFVGDQRRLKYVWGKSESLTTLRTGNLEFAVSIEIRCGPLNNEENPINDEIDESFTKTLKDASLETGSAKKEKKENHCKQSWETKMLMRSIETWMYDQPETMYN